MTEAEPALDETQERNIPLALELYPNPTSGILNIHCQGMAATEDGVLQVIDPLGRTVLENSIKGSRTILNVSKIRGLFTLRLSTKTQTLSKPFIVQ